MSYKIDNIQKEKVIEIEQKNIDVNKAIRSVSRLINQNPFNMFSEADIQNKLHGYIVPQMI